MRMDLFWNCWGWGQNWRIHDGEFVIPERFCSGDSLRRGAISSVWSFTFTFLWTVKPVQEQFIRPTVWYKSAHI